MTAHLCNSRVLRHFFQVIVLSQLWICMGSLMDTTFPCVGGHAKTYRQHALETKEDLKLLRN
jgi:hypothetical protein